MIYQKQLSSMKEALESEVFEKALLNQFKSKKAIDAASEKINQIKSLLDTIPNKYLRKRAY